MRTSICYGFVALAFPMLSLAHDDNRGVAQPKSIADVQAEIASLKKEGVAWRKIQWKTCLVDGLRESRAQNKPMLVRLGVACWRSSMADRRQSL